MKQLWSGWLSGLVLLIAGQAAAQTGERIFLFAGHTYEWHTGGSRVDPRLEQIDLKRFDRIWLGGDVCSEASLNWSTLQYIDSLFAVSDPQNHWSPGNHDIRSGNLDWVTEITKRDTYYAYHLEGLTTLVLNTCLTPAHCRDLDNQFRLIQQVCDTITSSSHLIVLMHHAVWDKVPGLPPPSQYSHTYFPFWNPNCYSLTDNTFSALIYPLLVDVYQRGVQVICITGDMGATKKKLEVASDDGIIFLGCGLNNTYFTDPEERAAQPRDLVLIFRHDVTTRFLTWEFVELNSLLTDLPGQFLTILPDKR